VAFVETAEMLRSWWRPLGQRAARAYVAGPHLRDALGACAKAASRGFASAIGFWDGGESAREVADQYRAALDAISAGDLDSYVSVKAPAVGFSGDILRAFLVESASRGVRVHFDSLAEASAAPTWSLIEAARRHGAALGCTLPARWRRSLRDAERLVEWGVAVRLVKGEEPGREAGDLEPRAGLLALVDRLGGRAHHVAVATHDAPLAQEALARLAACRTSAELELLFGLPLLRPVAVARRAGVPVRIYVPYGHARLPYRLSEVGARPAVLWWAARDLLHDGLRSFSSARFLAKEA
jgi:proline dehydrogenase